MTRQELILIATAISEARAERGHEVTVAAVDDVARKLGRYFSLQSPCFDLDRFLRACGQSRDVAVPVLALEG